MSESVAVVVQEKPRCGAKARHGGTCRHWAGARTDHPGVGRCWMHGGRQQTSQLTHGRYSTIKRERIADLIAEYRNDPDPLNIGAEIAALRALFHEYIERYDEFTEALLAWHASFQLERRPLPEEHVIAFEAVITEWEIKIRDDGEITPKQQGDLDQAKKFMQILRKGTDATKPRTVLDISDAYRVLGEIGRMVERVEKIRNINGITRADFNRLHAEMVRVVATHVADDTVKQRILDGWLAIRF